MILNVYSIFDKAVGAHMQPFFARSEGEALRMIKQAVNDKNSGFYQNPADYILTYHGSFEDNTGTFEIADTQNLIVLSSLTEHIAPMIATPQPFTFKPEP